MKRKVLIVVVVLLLAGSAYYHFTHQAKQAPAWHAKPTVVKVTPVTYQTLPNKIDAVGTLKALDKVKITAEVAGKVAKIDFVPGASVKKGTVLIQLDDTIFKADLKAAKADLVLSRLNYQRFENLAKRGLLAKQKSDEALADLEDKQASVDVKSTQLAKMSLQAPFDGLLGARLVSIGGYVAVGQALVTIVDINNLLLQYQVPEKYLAQLKVGQPVSIKTNAYPTQHFAGKVSFISPMVDEETRTVLLQATIPNGDHRLRPGLFVKLKQQLGLAKKSLVIPEESLIPAIEGEHVFVVEKGKAVTKRIKTGLRHGRWVQVLSGLKASDVVVTAGHQKLKDGAAVKIETAKP